MSIYVLLWVKEDLEKQGKVLSNYKLAEVKGLLDEYNRKYKRVEGVQ